MMWKKANGIGALVAIVAGVGLSYGIQPLYSIVVESYASEANGVVSYSGLGKSLVDTFGANLNFFHAVFVAGIICLLLHVGISLVTKGDEEKSKLTWTGVGVCTPETMKKIILAIAVSLVVFAVLAVLMVPMGEPSSDTEQAKGILPPLVCGLLAAIWTFALFNYGAVQAIKKDPDREISAKVLLTEDRCWAGLLGACAIFMMYYFY